MGLLCGIALAIRSFELERYPLQVDWANYLFSAAVHDIKEDESLAEAVLSEMRWIESREFGHKPMPHSYLHQFLIRLSYRVFRSSMSAVCFAAIVLGSLTPIVLLRNALREGRIPLAPASYAAGILVVAPFHVVYSRSGWSEIPAAALGLVYFYQSLAFLNASRDHRNALGRMAAAMSLTLLGACGFHEMAVGGGFGTLLACSLQRIRVLGAYADERFDSVRMVYAALSTIPAVTYALAVFSIMPRALREYTFSTPTQYLGDVRRMFDGVWVQQELFHQFSLPLLLLAAVGVARLWARERRQCILLLAQLMGWAIILMMMPNTTMRNVRVFIPAFVLMMIAVMHGLAWLYSLTSLRRELFHSAAVCLVGYLAYTSLSLVWLDANVPWTGQYIPRQLTHAGRDAALPLRTYIETAIQPSDDVGALFIMEGVFYLEDAGLTGRWLGHDFAKARAVFRRDRSGWPRFVVASPNRWPPGTPKWFQSDFMAAYELRSSDRFGRCGVFVRKDAKAAQALTHSE